jgi:hypothetical protein
MTKKIINRVQDFLTVVGEDRVYEILKKLIESFEVSMS